MTPKPRSLVRDPHEYLESVASPGCCRWCGLPENNRHHQNRPPPDGDRRQRLDIDG